MMIDVRTPEGLLLGRVCVHDWVRVGTDVVLPLAFDYRRAPDNSAAAPTKAYEARVERWTGPSAPRGALAIKWTGSLAQLRNIASFEECAS